MSAFNGQKFMKVLILMHILTKDKHVFKQEELANEIGLSTKQLARYFKKFEELSFCRYTAGKGRSHSCEVHWNDELHTYLNKELLQLANAHLLDAFPIWIDELVTDGLKVQVAKFFEQYVFQHLNKSNNDTLYLPMYQSVASMNPLQATDFYSVAIMKNIFNTLVVYNDVGELAGSLAISWNCNETSIVFYLRKNVVFHHGINLDAWIICDCLLQNEKLVEKVGILEIRVLHEYAIEILHEGVYENRYLLSLLSQANASIYVRSNETFYGTGPYQITNHTKNSLLLTYFPYHFGQIAMLKQVQFLTIPRSIKRKYDFSNHNQDYKIYSIEVSNVNLLLNPGSPYFKKVSNRQKFVECWGDNRGYELSEDISLKIGISKHKHELNTSLKSVYKDVFPKINWVPISFEEYIKSEEWHAFDAIMITHAFTENQPIHKLLEVIDATGVYAKFYPEFCKHFEGILKFSTQKITLEDFYRVLVENDFIVPLDHYGEDMLISDHLMIEGTNLMSSLSGIWKKD
ncbi:periplasmic substrate-binding domain-containing protein [Lysinibacillus xylanilyticus]|uniref:hypothetical protein n=1 Tax=Lysinibacillus xylanilyticus TaxID=582475 RepID=UPI003820AC6B